MVAGWQLLLCSKPPSASAHSNQPHLQKQEEEILCLEGLGPGYVSGPVAADTALGR